MHHYHEQGAAFKKLLRNLRLSACRDNKKSSTCGLCNF
jgi:hypothetical protein